MSELTREEKLKMIEKLPPRLQEFFYSEDAGATLFYFGRKYNLPDEKVHLLSKLAGDVVLKIVPATSLVQEINSKILPDVQAAMNLAQELYTELLAPILSPQAAPAATATQPKTAPSPVAPSAAVDRYRESIPSRVVNLRKPAPPIAAPQPKIETPLQPVISKPVTPPAPIIKPTPPVAKPAPATPAPQPPKPSFYFAPLKKPTPPPMAEKPIFKLPLIEASPHEILAKKLEPIVPNGPSPIQQKETSAPGRQFILRPPGMPPTELPHDILDLRKDKGEF
ncbi:MAG: hypothetical protein UV53_C0011G0009 [Candidatus Azambacteria bacterium GW2011_GWE1_42_9]|nr:MAG: hypothetical protein UU33_C0001G0371 [Candidatus Azambacteria bacterium GW2011_GWF1_41_10]KKS49405.1 MAG: hypothetical protein UV14_C0001G0151 [Candidatus Azambacteria bacterium GW2011_GWF2_42_22]KKS69466.1 MAG: hypothetical protein UV39_C0010G0006 [Candidatus Azambacteria bacterium GW2011_GWA2_42_62]KKS74327.1 MAG: hypothetical protein UV45_C0007G0021 [Candidatus Azambacteria bacterium GW2011_GWB1_42_72]KKS79236.1 MAG: hypothetical protein UV53_C0011G0009 [Candidatus Azambacteria bacte